PALLTLNLDIKSSTVTAPAAGGGEEGVGQAPAGACNGCAALTLPVDGSIRVTAGANKFLNPDSVNKLSSLSSNLKNAGITGATINEGYNPNGHQNVCHANGTCVDLNLHDQGGETPANIRTVIAETRRSGLLAIFEVKTQDEKNTIINSCGTDQACRT